MTSRRLQKVIPYSSFTLATSIVCLANGPHLLGFSEEAIAGATRMVEELIVRGTEALQVSGTSTSVAMPVSSSPLAEALFIPSPTVATLTTPPSSSVPESSPSTVTTEVEATMITAPMAPPAMESTVVSTEGTVSSQAPSAGPVDDLGM